MKLYWLTIIAFGLISGKLFADDTEIYLGTADRTNPNVIFIFDTSGSMGAAANSSGETRLDLVQRAAIDTIKDTSGINIALMRYGPYREYYESGQDKQYRGGYLSTAMLDIDADGVKSNLENIINNYPAGGGTPMTEAVHEALNFLRGNTIDYGRTKQKSWNSWTYLGPSATRDGDKYISPINDQCQKNHIVLFTDGDSSVDGESNEQIREWIKSLPAADRPSGLSTSCTSNGGGNISITNSCIEELAYYMYNSDSSSSLEGMQRVQFHAVGGFLSGNSQTFLDNAAYYGGGISASADTYEGLKNALTKIFDDIAQSAGTFAAPAVAVNAFNSLEQLDQLYYSVFKPHEAVGWSGNVKRFRMRSDGVIVDVNGNPAVDPTTGFFAKNAQSFWTQAADAPDGDNVVKGGMASRLSTDRKVYTNIASNDLTSTNKNLVHENNTSLKSTHFNSALSGEEYKKLVQWARGLDVKATSASNPRREMADPLHSRPVLVNYGYILDANNKKIPDSTLFIGTNAGYLHAFDTNSSAPKERFSFIPKELLPITHDYYAGGGTKKYGLDGAISLWHQDKNRNQIVDNNEKAYLYIGMRRGGRTYYAMDISNRDKPILKWQITGGVTSGFDKLGQTWSRMSPVDVIWQGQPKKVLIFGGGYDPREDDFNQRTAHDMGNAIYMVDAETGTLLWRASNESGASLRLTSMTSSIVGNIVTVDDNSDGYVDLLYAADVGGRIWRIDFDITKTTASTYAKGGLIADLGVNSSEINNVRFYTTPDVVYSEYGTVWETDATTGKTVARKGVGRYQIAIGSGYRAHPLNDRATDHFYVLNDYAVEGAPATYPNLKKSNLADYARYSSETNAKKNNGLFYKLPNTGEKVLSNSVTLKDTIYFTTYRPVDAASRSGCEADTGRSILYTISPDYESERIIDPTPLKQAGIVSEGVLITTVNNEDGKEGEKEEFLLIGAEAIKLDDSGSPFRKTYWREIQ